jgi:type IV secretory pathway VirB9-like protein
MLIQTAIMPPVAFKVQVANTGSSAVSRTIVRRSQEVWQQRLVRRVEGIRNFAGVPASARAREQLSVGPDCMLFFCYSRT